MNKLPVAALVVVLASALFSFAIGGIGAVFYNGLMHKRLEPIDPAQHRDRRHIWHGWALATPFALFPILYFLPWNPIYAGIGAMVVGAIVAGLCRPDLAPNTLVGGLLFLALYTVLLLALKW